MSVQFRLPLHLYGSERKLPGKDSEVRKVVVLNVAGLSWKSARSADAPTISSLGGARPMRPSFPAVTCTAQATLATGADPSRHGIVANGLFDRDYRKVSFWEQSSALVQAPAIWEIAGRKNPDFVSAVLFWQNIMGAGADVTLTPAPIHKADGGMISSCYAQPAGLYEELAGKLGAFDLMSYWGPMASVKSSQWIAAAAREVFEKLSPDLLMVYLPHLDYPLQKYGPDGPELQAELRQADALVAEIRDWAAAGGAELVALSEYGMTNVSGAITPNRVLREAGLLEVREVEGMELLDLHASKAFAMADHQVAHIYARKEAVHHAQAALAATDGVETILGPEEKADMGIDHPRSGELIAVSRPDKWFAYYWWQDADRAPDFARTVDIHRKPGYDPCELFIDPATRSISMDTSLVKGSHGRAGEDIDNMAFFASESCNTSEGVIDARDVAGLLLDMIQP